MHQLNGVDAFHVLEERPRQHMHTIKIAILDPSGASRPLTVDAIRAWVTDRLVHIPPLRWQLVNVPARLGRPLWRDCGPLDLDYHVQAVTLRRADPVEFDEVVSRIGSEQLDRSHPLWQLTYVDRLEQERVALVFKLHHSIMDGQASVRLFETAFDCDQPFPFPTVPVQAEPVPAPGQVMRHVWRNQGRQWAAIPSVFRRSVGSIRDNRVMKKSGAPPVVNPMSGPLTRFNAKLTPERIYVDVTVPFAQIRAAKDAVGATVNEVFVTLCGGAVRRYLDEHGELAAQSLTCALPVSLRAPHERDTFGNRTSYWYVSLGTDIADPLARLERVRDSLAAARAWAKGDVELFAVWMDYYLLFGALTLRSLNLVENVARRPLFNAIVSNVKGPPPLSLYGAPVVDVRSMGPLSQRLGLNLTAWTYRDNFSIGLHACRQAMPDLRRLADHLRAELEAFTRAGDPTAAQPRPASSPSARRYEHAAPRPARGSA